MPNQPNDSEDDGATPTKALILDRASSDAMQKRYDSRSWYEVLQRPIDYASISLAEQREAFFENLSTLADNLTDRLTALEQQIAQDAKSATTAEHQALVSDMHALEKKLVADVSKMIAKERAEATQDLVTKLKNLFTQAQFLRTKVKANVADSAGKVKQLAEQGKSVDQWQSLVDSVRKLQLPKSANTNTQDKDLNLNNALKW